MDSVQHSVHGRLNDDYITYIKRLRKQMTSSKYKRIIRLLMNCDVDQVTDQVKFLAHIPITSSLA